MNRAILIAVSLSFLSLSYFLNTFRDSEILIDNTQNEHNTFTPLELDTPDQPVCTIPVIQTDQASPITKPINKNQESCKFNDTELTIPPPESKPAWNFNQIHTFFKKYNFDESGLYQPENCKPASVNAIIVCYRDRDQHLRYFLEHTIKTLIRQNSAFKIYLVEPPQNTTFNRAKLFNVGFAEAMKDKGDDFYNCVTFHDVDLMHGLDYLSHLVFLKT